MALAFSWDRIVFDKKEEDYDWPVRYTMPFKVVSEGRAGIYPEAGHGCARKRILYLILLFLLIRGL